MQEDNETTLEAILQNQDEKLEESNELLEKILEQTHDNNSEDLMSFQLEKLDEIAKNTSENKKVEVEVKHPEKLKVDFLGGVELMTIKGKDGKDGENGKDGRDGKDGKDGYTPIKGKDYFDGVDGVDGKDGKDGTDGLDGKDVDIDEVISSVLNKIPKNKTVKYNPDTPEQIIEKLNKVVDFSKFLTREDADLFIRRVSSKTVSLKELDDVDLSGLSIVDGKYVLDSRSSSTFLDLTDTPSSYSGQAGKFPKVNAGETALEFVTISGGGDMLASTYDPANKSEQVLTISDIDDTAYDATSWNGVTDVAPSKNAVRDKIDSMDTAIALNTAKVTNATHTGEVTGSTTLTVDKTAISNRSDVAITASDYIVYGDASDSDNLKKDTVQGILDLVPAKYANIDIDLLNPTTGAKGVLMVENNATITGWTILSDASTSIVIDIWKDSYANYLPTVADTITGSEKPTLSSANKNQDLSLSTWTTSLSRYDILRYNVDSVTLGSATWVKLVIHTTLN